MTGEIVDLEVALIDPGPVVRAVGIDQDHATALVPSIESLPPIITRASGERLTLIDGAHRLEAHRIAGRGTIKGVVVDLSDAEAFEEAVKANIAHGKPLTLAERKTAAATLLELRPEWSNSHLASVVGLSDKTVAALRPRPGSENPNLDTRRHGGDGKNYPPSSEVSEAKRVEIRIFIDTNPGLSDRYVANKFGVSPTTVGGIRKTAAEPAVPAPDGGGDPSPEPAEAEGDDSESPQGSTGGDADPPPVVPPFDPIAYRDRGIDEELKVRRGLLTLDPSLLAQTDRRPEWVDLARDVIAWGHAVEKACSGKPNLRSA